MGHITASHGTELAAAPRESGRKGQRRWALLATKRFPYYGSMEVRKGEERGCTYV